jgi:hypothetical protein
MPGIGSFSPSVKLRRGRLRWSLLTTPRAARADLTPPGVATLGPPPFANFWTFREVISLASNSRAFATSPVSPAYQAAAAIAGTRLAMLGITPWAPTAQAELMRNVAPRNLYGSSSFCWHSITSWACSSPVPDESLIPTTVPSCASWNVVVGSTPVLTVIGISTA